MKKVYVKPRLEAELFSLGQNIAACSEKVTFSPDDPEVCGEYFPAEPFSYSLEKRSAQGQITPFHDVTTCYCYVTAPKDSGFFNS